jgi:hypothetical protein
MRNENLSLNLLYNTYGLAQTGAVCAFFGQIRSQSWQGPQAA